MFGAYAEFWKRYVDFGGTSTRSKFWYVVLVNVLIGLLLGILTAVIPAAGKAFDAIDSIYGLAILIP